MIDQIKMNYFEELLKKPTLFKDERKLDINFIPEQLPHRESELSLLSQLFLSLLTNPNTISRKVLISGKTGIGKTATIKYFGMMLESTAEKKEIPIKVIHINCRKEHTSYKVLIKIMHSFNNNFPRRGYSPQDLLEIINSFLIKDDIHLVVILDELGYLINKGGDLIYSLTRLNDDSFNKKQRLSLIGIVRDISSISNLDDSTQSTLQRNIIRFDVYTKKQIFEILKYRTSISLKDNVISDGIIDMIAKLVLENGDLRMGIDLIWRATKIAESQDLKYISSECVRLGCKELIPLLTQDTIKNMTREKLIFLLSIVKTLLNSDKTDIFISDIKIQYKILCENLGMKPRMSSQLWNYLQEFKKRGIISFKVLSEKIKGRKGIIEISNVPLSKLEIMIINHLNFKGVLL